MAEAYSKDELDRRMKGAVATLKSEFGGLRTGRASPAQLFQGLTLRMDAKAQGGGAVTALLGLRHLEDDFGIHDHKIPEPSG